MSTLIFYNHEFISSQGHGDQNLGFSEIYCRILMSLKFDIFFTQDDLGSAKYNLVNCRA